MKKPRNLAERFWEKVSIGAANQCWNWKAYTDAFGYGIFRLNTQRNTKAHRTAWTLTHGEIPIGQYVLHRCDNPACCNPNHHFLGTYEDNVHDMRDKGRAKKARGIHHARARLNPDAVRRIRALRADGLSQQKIADIFGTPQTNVSLILRGKAWAHVI